MTDVNWEIWPGCNMCYNITLSRRLTDTPPKDGMNVIRLYDREKG